MNQVKQVNQTKQVKLVKEGEGGGLFSAWTEVGVRILPRANILIGLKKLCREVTGGEAS